MNPYETLACAIFKQARDDYLFLTANRIDVMRTSRGTALFSLADVETFFKSKWCSRLLDMIGSDLTGADMLRIVRSQCA